MASSQPGINYGVFDSFSSSYCVLEICIAFDVSCEKEYSCLIFSAMEQSTLRRLVNEATIATRTGISQLLVYQVDDYKAVED